MDENKSENLEVPMVKAKKRSSKKNKDYYVDPKEFKKELVNYYKDPKGELNNKLGDMINKIAVGVGYSPNFINYTYLDQMRGDAIEKMIKALRNKTYKINSSFPPFNYFSTITINAFKNRIKKEKKAHNTIEEYKDRTYEHIALEYGIDISDLVNGGEDSEGSYEF